MTIEGGGTGAAGGLPRIGVLIERAPKRVFACALDWPGWCRSGRDDTAALAALATYGPRYAPVLRRAGTAVGIASILGRDGTDAIARLEASDVDAVFEVVEQTGGGSGTAFGVPSVIADADRRPVDAAEASRLAAIVSAAWGVFDDVVAAAPAELRTGPRGGGRDTARIVEHVIGADQAYAAQIGLRIRTPDATDRPAVDAMRSAILEVLRAPSDGAPLAGKKWTQRYAARRIAWHALDHAWEIEDRTERT